MFGALFFLLLALVFIPYAAIELYCSFFCKPQNLKKKYKASWALVTGASSGLGKALSKRLAEQGLNVVLVALDDDLLDATWKEFKQQHPEVEFRKLGLNLGKPESYQQLGEKTEDLDIQVVFCNAGYMLTGFFWDVPAEAHMTNLQCNANSAMYVTHVLLARLRKKKLPGCFVFTSSPAALMPSPFSVMYASSKAFLSSFGASLAAEVKSSGIDVLVWHPSPVASRFYDKAHKMDMLEFFKGFAVDASAMPDAVLASIGRTVWRDVGATAIVFRLMMKLVDYNFLSTLLSKIAHTMPDFKRHFKPLP